MAETRKLTKKAYREYLNKIDADNPQIPNHRHKRYQQRTRLYGDYLYAQDRDKFNWEYEEWVKEQSNGRKRA